jgi:putative transposase
VRNLMTFAHATFRVSLTSYAMARGVNVQITNESFTTKTCTNCGAMEDRGGAHKITCRKCQTTIDRDFAGARNICLRAIAPWLGGR